MPRRRSWPDALPDVFLGSELVGHGVLTPAQLRDPRLRRHFVDAYSPRYVTHDHVLDCRAALLVLPDTARLTGRSLATARGVPLLKGGDAVEVVVPQAQRRPGPRGVLVRGVSSGHLGSSTWRGLRVATPERMAFDLAARHPLEAAVGHLDAVARARLVDVARLRRWLVDQHDDDVVHVREAAALVDPRAESLPESAVRVRLVRAGFDVTPQHDVRVGGRFVARVDLALVVLRIAIEYEGRWRTLLEGQLSQDRLRLDALREAGWVVVHVTAELMRQPGAVEDAVRRAVAGRTAA
ncbi:endonuclease domain-containing protein [Quadrisphaera sp. KR29]|uniref:endonuclease domain-containing protein n=1 Tax=Quadrisphaera sp. KR29 TaxID=3461391 RepID=UPI004044B7FB